MAQVSRLSPYLARPGGLFLLLAFLVAPQACRKHQADIPVAFEKKLPGQRVIDRCLERDRQALKQFRPQGLVSQWLESLQAFNRLAADKQSPPSELETAFAQLKEHTRQLLEQQGRRQLKLAVLYALDKFTKTLDELLLQANRQATQALTRGQPLPAELRQTHGRLVSWGADFLQHALQAGLLQLNGQRLDYASAGRFYVRVAFKVRLAALIPELDQPLEWLLDDQERLWYYRWVVEHSRSATPERRLRAIKELARLDPDYPEIEARGIVHFQAGHFGAARADFEMALAKRPGDQRLQNWLAQAQRRQQEQGKPSGSTQAAPSSGGRQP